MQSQTAKACPDAHDHHRPTRRLGNRLKGQSPRPVHSRAGKHCADARRVELKYRTLERGHVEVAHAVEGQAGRIPYADTTTAFANYLARCLPQWMVWHLTYPNCASRRVQRVRTAGEGMAGSRISTCLPLPLDFEKKADRFWLRIWCVVRIKSGKNDVRSKSHYAKLRQNRSCG